MTHVPKWHLHTQKGIPGGVEPQLKLQHRPLSENSFVLVSRVIVLKLL